MVDSDNIIGFDLVGKVKRLRFYKTQVLLPLFEAVVNSIHSIQRMKINNGIIDISFNRDNSQGVIIKPTKHRTPLTNPPDAVLPVLFHNPTKTHSEEQE